MNKVFAVTLVTMLFAVSVFGQSRLATDVAPMQGGMQTLDIAIQNSGNQLNRRYQRQTRVVMANISSPTAAFSNYVMNEMSARFGNYIVVNRESAANRRESMHFGVNDSVSQNTLLEFGRALDAHVVITGVYARNGRNHRVTFRFIDVRTGRTEVTYNMNILHDRKIAELLNMSAPPVATARCGVSVTYGGELADNFILRDVSMVSNITGANTPTAGLLQNVTMNDVVVSGGSAMVTVTASEKLTDLLVKFGSETHTYGFAISDDDLTSESAGAFTYSVSMSLSQTVLAGTQQITFTAVSTDNCKISEAVSKSVTVRRVGSGNLQITLTWNTNDDLDLHVRVPSGVEIYYNNKNVGNGNLDLDANANCPGNDVRNENIYFTGTLEDGDYVVFVNQYKKCMGNATYTITASAGGHPFIFSDNQTGTFSPDTPNRTKREIGVITVRNGEIIIP